jgi:hypothetical protein
MPTLRWRERGFALLCLLLTGTTLPASESGAAVTAQFDLRTPSSAPFPSNRFTVADRRNLTNLRIALPKPDCTKRPSDCADLDIINTLDGFNLQPRLRIPFSGPIHPASVSSSTIFLVELGDVTQAACKVRRIIGINQSVWDPKTNTLYAEADQVLEQHSIYVLIVTNGVRDAQGAALTGGDFGSFSGNLADYRFSDARAAAYRTTLLDAVQRSGIAPARIIAASVFTTLSVTSYLEKIRNQIKASTPAAADFLLASDGSRTVFPTASLANLLVSRQVGTAPKFQTQPTPPPALFNAVPNSVSRLAFGRFASPDYLTTQQVFPAIATRSGVPVVQRINHIYFNLVLPAGSKPASGWPVAIYGSGLGSNKETILAFASVLASRGIATIGINVVGHGGGAQGTLTVNRTGGAPVTLPAGGRSFDQNGDTTIEPTEGVFAAPARSLLNYRDGMRQTVVDLMQLTRIIESGGVDVNGDGTSDLDAGRIYYFGISFGGLYGPMLLAVDPAVSAGVPNVGGGSTIELARLGVLRNIPAAALASRTPSLLNLTTLGAPSFGFNENLPLRNRPTLVNKVAGALQIQEYFERWEWASMPGDPLGYVSHLRSNPLSGVSPKSVIVQFAKGDQTVPNPAASALIRAGDLADRATYFRNDLAVAANPALPRDPHPFLGGLIAPATAPFALAAQTQIAAFFASDGLTIMDPDGPGTLFETPIIGPLPEELNFLQ